MKLKFRLLCIGIFLGSCLQQSFAQTISVSGKIKNSNTSEPLERATVSVKGTTNATTSDQNGNFTIAAEKGSMLIITSTGFVQSTYKINGPGNINILLQGDDK